MKRMLNLAPFLLLAIVAGCSSPTQQAYAIRLTFNGAGQEIVNLRQAGKFPDPGYESVAIAANALAPRLDDLDTAAVEAESAGPTETIQTHFHFNSLLRSVNSAIDQITAKLLSQRSATTKPA